MKSSSNVNYLVTLRMSWPPPTRDLFFTLADFLNDVAIVGSDRRVSLCRRAFKGLEYCCGSSETVAAAAEHTFLVSWGVVNSFTVWMELIYYDNTLILASKSSIS